MIDFIKMFESAAVVTLVVVIATAIGGRLERWFLARGLVKALADRLNGRISRTSPDHGTTFESSFASRTASEARSCGGEAADRDLRILVCEDEPDVAATIARILEAEGMIVDVAENETAARWMLQKHRYQAIALDVRLPDGSGIRLYEQIRACEPGSHLPVIILSGVVDEARKAINGTAVGIVDWLSKPVSVGDMARAVGRLRTGDFRRRPTILHVEDDRDVLAVTAATLGDEFEIVAATSALEARQKLGFGKFDLVILDIGLPDASGETVLGHVPAGVPVIILSAKDAEGHLAETVEVAMTKTKASEIAIADMVRTVVGRTIARSDAA